LVIAVVTAFLAAGYGQGAADVSLGGETPASQQCLETDWVARFNGALNRDDYATAIAVDADGNSYVTGESCALVDDFGNCYVTQWGTLKYDPNGNQLWAKTFRGPGSWYNKPNAIAVDSSNNVHVTGSMCIQAGCDPEGCFYCDLDYATVKYSPAGQQLWVARYSGVGGSGVDEAQALALDSSGNVYVTGSSEAANGLSDYATIKYNSSGSQTWVTRYNGPGNASDDARAIKLDPTGNVYVTGGSTGASGYLDYATLKYSASGSQLLVARYDGPGGGNDDAKGLAVDSSGNAYVTGYSLGAATSDDYGTIKYDTLGNELWVARYDGPGQNSDQATAITLDSVGNVYVTGASWGIGTNVDYATTMYDSNGNQVWVARYDGSAHGGDYASAIALDSSGNIHVTGRSHGGVGTWNDYATIRYDQGGVQTRVIRYDGPGNFEDVPAALAVDQNGNVYVTGGSWSDGSMGNGHDYATIKYSQLSMADTDPCPDPNSFAPVANNDSYSTNQNTPLTVLGAGVLTNDTDADNNSLTAVIVSNPSHAASFTLNSNGSFSYTPVTIYVGPDSFTYRANDGAKNSNVATVTITVNDVTPPAITITSPAPNATYQLNATVAASYACADSGSGVATCQGTVASESLIDTASTGTKTFSVRSSDNAGNGFGTSVAYSVVSGGGSMSADLGITLSAPARVSSGGSLTYSMTVSNGGKVTATGVVVSNPLPAGTVFASAAASQQATIAAPPIGSNGTVTVNLDSLANGAKATVSIVATVPVTTVAGTVLTDTATVTATTQDLNSSNNSATQKTTVAKNK